ncbi:MAG: HAMP domain-containing sensor histidine kinase [Pseudomonadota bacterium]
MWSRIRSLFRVTAVRLSIIYTLIFGIFAVGVVGYMTGATVNLLRDQIEESINQEVQGLARIYSQRGLRALIGTLERRARSPGANLYAVTSPSGEILGGNVPQFERDVMRKIGWTKRPFGYERYGDDDDRKNRAIARIIEVPNGLRILVGRDIGDTEGFRHVIRRGFVLALGTMLALGVLTWLFVGRRALKRIDEVSQSSVKIMGGDRSERLPVTGSGDEFDRLSGSLNQMLDRIHQLDDGLKQMSDNIAHDLKTPITRLRNKADEALSIKNNPTGREAALEAIIADCDQIVRTFDALLMISRVESGSTVARMAEVDLASILEEVHELYEAIAEEEGITLAIDLAEAADSLINGNRELLAQALSNLIDNAMKYGQAEDKDAQILLSLRKTDNQVILSVADNGPGVADEDLDRVKGRFVRLDKSRNKSGNGLGLSLVDAIAGLHGGTLTLENGNPGMKASIRLPRDGRDNA